MANNSVFVSPGVFTRERDQSFLQRGVSAIGAAFIGNTQKGPAFTPTTIANFNEFRANFGNLDPNYYMPYSVYSYMKNSGVGTIVRVLGIGGYKEYAYIPLMVSKSDNTQVCAAILRPTASGSGITTPSVSCSAYVTGSPKAAGLGITDLSNFSIYLTGSVGQVSYSNMSLRSADNNYIGKILGTNPRGNSYLYASNVYNWTVAGVNTASNYLVIMTGALSGQSNELCDFTMDYNEAETPWVISQKYGIAPNTSSYNLMKVFRKSHGNSSNTEIKLAFQDMTVAPVSGPDNYGTFTVVVRDFNDTDKKANVYEVFSNLNFNPNSKNYVAKRIGDRYSTTDTSGRITKIGNYDPRSDYIRVEMADMTTVPTDVLPFGFSKYLKIKAYGTISAPDFPLQLSQSINGEYSTKAYYGIDFTQEGLESRFSQFPEQAAPASDSQVFYLENCSLYTASGFSPTGVNVTSSNSAKKFIMGFYQGFDGDNPLLKMGYESSERYDTSTSTTSGTVAFRRAVDTLRDPEQLDINMLAIPGVSDTSVTDYALEMVEDRADAFYVMDLCDSGSSIDDAISNAVSFDSNYAAVYYPWLVINDVDNEKPVTVPPSCLVPGAISYNDTVGFPWYAPAGLNRGGLPTVIEAVKILNQPDADQLYLNRINPIKSFPTEGIVIWGQKTLQVRPSALDRVNVRRLLIYAKKLISSASKYLVFEPNNSKTWDKFINLVNPILENIQVNQGLEAFKVIMDSSNNTPDLIDQNIMSGKLYLQPTRTAEILILDFIIQRTGASFSE